MKRSAEALRKQARELRESCSSPHVGWGLEVARYRRAEELEAEAAALESAEEHPVFRPYRAELEVP